MKRTTRSDEGVERPAWLRIIDGGKQSTVTERGGIGGGITLPASSPTQDPLVLADLGEIDRVGCLDRGIETDPIQGDDGGAAGGGRRRPRSPSCDPGHAHWTFANEIVRKIKRDPHAGSFWITISPPVGVALDDLYEEVRVLLDERDCDHSLVQDWGERNDHGHLHLVVHMGEPTTLYEMFGPLLRLYAVRPESFKVTALWGWSDYARGRSDNRFKTDLANLAWYCTQPPKGEHARLPSVHTTARGIFHGPWTRLMRVTPPMTRVPACVACGGPRPSGAPVNWRSCGNKCRQRNHQRRKKERARKPWRVMLPKTYVRRLGDAGRVTAALGFVFGEKSKPEV